MQVRLLNQQRSWFGLAELGSLCLISSRWFRSSPLVTLNSFWHLRKKNININPAVSQQSVRPAN